MWTAIILIGIDVEGETKIPQLFRCDPAGHFVGFKATSAGTRRAPTRAASAASAHFFPLRLAAAALTGQKEQEANNFLEKRYKTEANPALSYDDTVQLALACMQNVLGSDLKASDIEVRALRTERAPARAQSLTSDLRWRAQASVVRADNLNFTQLTNDEIEAQLTALAEREDETFNARE